jgi:hypothetical protein
MKHTEINGVDFYSYFKSGAEEVQKNKDNLNSINVFPVKDGDTGTNLAITMNSIVNETTVTEDFHVVINSMSNVAFENARGNSGIIFASFISGFSDACGQLKSLNIEQFSSGATLAVEAAYSAVSIPVEGTMLTVIREWANYIAAFHDKHHSFGELLEAAYEKAKQTLEETPDMLEILRKNRVVDSGAKGFVMFLSGFGKLFANGHVHHEDWNQNASTGIQGQAVLDHHFDDKIHSNFDDAIRSSYDDATHQHNPNFRYCTEVLLHDTVDHKAHIEPLLKAFGDSMIITGNQKLVKIHIHTDRPDLVTQTLVINGYKVNKSKVDDMLLQTDIEYAPKSKIAILTDSIADLTEAQCIEEQVHMLSLPLIVDDSIYLDKRTVTLDNLQSILDNCQTYPSSSQPDVKQVKAKFEWLLDHYEQIVVISVASALSGTYESYRRAILELGDSGKRITLIDSKLNSGAQGLIVYRAVKMANSGESLENILRATVDAIQKTSIYVSLDTFEYAVKSGRVPNKIGHLLMNLGAKPIMTLSKEGKGAAFGLAFSRKAIDHKIYKKVNKILNSEGIEEYAIVHANNPKLAKRYCEAFGALIGFEPTIVTDISAVTTIHAGIGSVAIALTRRK